MRLLDGAADRGNTAITVTAISGFQTLLLVEEAGTGVGVAEAEAVSPLVDFRIGSRMRMGWARDSKKVLAMGPSRSKGQQVGVDESSRRSFPKPYVQVRVGDASTTKAIRVVS
jgi:hypothetical protein